MKAIPHSRFNQQKDVVLKIWNAHILRSEMIIIQIKS